MKKYLVTGQLKTSDTTWNYHNLGNILKSGVLIFKHSEPLLTTYHLNFITKKLIRENKLMKAEIDPANYQIFYLDKEQNRELTIPIIVKNEKINYPYYHIMYTIDESMYDLELEVLEV